MADGQRKYPVNQYVIHHSYGPDFKDTSHAVIAKWFSDIGKNRGYAGLAHSGHFYTPKGGKRYETFAQAQLAGHWHNGKYCIFPIMDDIWNNVAWGAGNWAVNQQAINLENCGNYLTKGFTDIQSRAVADFWRPQDKKLNGKTYINPHSAVSIKGTACPARIKDAIPTIIKYVNNPPKPPVPVDPCKKYKDALAKANSALKVCSDKLIATHKELDASRKELLDCKTELDATKDKLIDCESKPTQEPCEVVKSLSWLEIFKCKWNVKE